jgi:hypothetical protein
VEYARIVNLATIADLQEERPTFGGFRVETDHLNDSLPAPARSRLDPKVWFLSDALGKESAHECKPFGLQIALQWQRKRWYR